jgi:cytochrome c oxidase subunit 2
MNAAPGSIFAPAGPTAQALLETSGLLIGGAAAVFAGMVALSVWVWMARRRPADERTLVRRWIAVGGLAFPGIVLAGLLVYTLRQTHALDPPPEDGAETVVAVTGHLWWWQVRYDDPRTGLRFVLANEIRVPVGRPVTLGLTSADVIHSLWVPALAGKVDMLPGRVHQLRVRADRPGTYRGQCAEFCGEQHARMALHVVALAPSDYDRWLEAQARPAVPPADAQAQLGLAVYERARCASCHDIRGLAPGASIGPDLTHVGARLAIGAGTLPNGRAALARWVHDAQRVKPGVRMPAYADLDEASLQALAAFLEQLR